MIEREVTDIFIISLSIFGVSLVIYSTDYVFSEHSLFIVGMSSIAIITFLHIVFTQLEMMNTQLSKAFSGLNLLLSIIAIIGYLTTDQTDWNGFWQTLNIDLSSLFIIMFTALFIAIFVSFVAKPMKLDKTPPKIKINSSSQ